MGKIYALDIQCCDSDNEQGVFSKGHHDFDKFVSAARDWHGDDLSRWKGKPKHVWWRTVPDPSGDHTGFYADAVPNSRGAFPVTVITEYE